MATTQTVPKYLIRHMPHKVLFGEAREIEQWCRDNKKAVPTLLDVGNARAQVRQKSRNRKREKAKSE